MADPAAAEPGPSIRMGRVSLLIPDRPNTNADVLLENVFDVTSTRHMVINRERADQMLREVRVSVYLYIYDGEAEVDI